MYVPWLVGEPDAPTSDQRRVELAAAQAAHGTGGYPLSERGFDAAVLAVYEQELNEPTPEAVQALAELIESGNHISAEIAARMMEQDYPSSGTAQVHLARVLKMGITQ